MEQRAKSTPINYSHITQLFNYQLLKHQQPVAGSQQLNLKIKK